MSPRLKRKSHGRIGTKVDYALLDGPVYRAIQGKDSNDLDEATPYVVLVSRIDSNATRDHLKELKLETWLDKHEIEPAPLSPFRKDAAEREYGVHLRLFHATDLPKLKKLPRSIHITDREELNAFGATEKLAPLLNVTLEAFREHKGADSGLGF